MYKGLWMRRIGKLFFAFSVLFALEMGAFGAVNITGENEALRAFAGQSFVIGAFALLVGALGVFVMSELALRYEEKEGFIPFLRVDLASLSVRGLADGKLSGGDLVLIFFALLLHFTDELRLLHGEKENKEANEHQRRDHEEKLRIGH